MSPDAHAQAVDSDFDGHSDEIELLIGTNPVDPGSVFQLLLPDVSSFPGEAGVAWTSVPGRHYRLEKWNAPDLGLVGDPAWIVVGEVTAESELSSLTVPTAAEDRTAYYRVRVDVDASQPPQFAVIPSADQTSLPGGISVFVPESFGAVRIQIKHGEEVLGEALPKEGGGYEFQFPRQPGENYIQEFQAVAEKADGTEARTSAMRLAVVDPDRFARLDAAGRPIMGAPILLDANGNAPALEYRPLAPFSLGMDAGLEIRFPQGLRFVETANGLALEFTHALAVFGGDAPVELFEVFQIENAAPRRLAVGAFSVGNFLTAFNKDSSSGIPLRWFGQFDLPMLSGMMSHEGIVAPELSLEHFDATPLSLGSFLLEAIPVDWSNLGELEFPAHGAFVLPGSDAEVRIDERNPARLKLKSDGGFSLSGGVEIRFADGPRFEASMMLDDPLYRFNVADTLELFNGLVIQQAQGSLTYDRLAQTVQGLIGGSLKVPGLGSLEIQYANFDNSGSFSGSALTPSPLEMGGVELQAELNFQSGPDGLSFEGIGELNLPEAFQDFHPIVVLDYIQEENRFLFKSIGEPSRLSFAEDFVLFDASLALETSTLLPEGALVFTGDAGLYSRLAPPPSEVSEDDFYFTISGASIEAGFDPEQFEIQIDRGTLKLPRELAAMDCETGTPIAGARPSVQLSEDQSLAVAFDRSENQLSIEGAVEIAGLGYEYLPGQFATLCSLTVLFQPNHLPVFTDAAGTLFIEYLGQSRMLAITHGEWRPDQPPSFTTALSEPIVLFDQGGYGLTLGRAGHPDCSGLAISFSDGGGVFPVMNLDGGVSLELPLSHLSQSNGDPVELRAGACARLSLEPGGIPRLSIPEIEVSGLDFELGMDTGIAVSGGVLKVNGLDTILPDPSQSQITVEIMGGSLEFPNGVSIQDVSGQFTSGGTFALGAGAATVQLGGTVIQIQQLFVEGDLEGSLFVSGSGFAEITPGEPAVEVDLAYNTAARSLAFSLQGRTPLMRFSEDFVLFDVGFDIQADSGAGAAGLALTGDAGIIAAGGVLSDPPVPSDFLVFIDGAVIDGELSADGFSIELVGGAMTLPGDFHAWDCETQSSATGQFPAILLSPAESLSVNYQPDPETVEFEGAIAVENLLMSPEEFPEFQLAVCSGAVSFGSASVPSLSNLNGFVRMPLTGGQALALQVENANWTLGQWPEARMELTESLTVFEQDDLRLTLSANVDPVCASDGRSFIQFGSLEDGTPWIDVAAGLELGVPPAWLSGPGGEPLTASGCASIQWVLGESPVWQSAEWTLPDADIQLGEDSGARVQGESFYVENLMNILNPSVSAPFAFGVEGGRVVFPNGVELELLEGRFSADGSFLVNAATETGSALEFSGFELSAEMDLRREASGELIFEGIGGLTVLDGGESYGLSLAYDSTLQRFMIGGQAGNARLAFAEDFVIQDPEFELEFTGADASAALRIRGNAGLLSRSPGAPPDSLDEEFYLTIDDLDVRFNAQPNQLNLALNSGTLNLPADIFAAGLCEDGDSMSDDSGPSIQLAGHPLELIIPAGASLGDPLSVSGAIQFQNLGVVMPGLENAAVELCEATLTFPAGQTPMLQNVRGRMQFPLRENELVELELDDGQWGLDGYPTGALSLVNNLALLDVDGFALTLIGRTEEDGEPEACATSVFVETGADGLPVFGLNAGLRFEVPSEVFTDEKGGQLAMTGCAGFTTNFRDLPQLTDAVLEISGENLKIGGEQGLLLENAMLRTEGWGNLFDLGPGEGESFDLVFGGNFTIQDAGGFGIQNAKIRFTGEPFPRLSAQQFCVEAGASLSLADSIPLSVRRACFGFVEPERQRLQELFAPDNIVIQISAGLEIPGGETVIQADVEDLAVKLCDGIPRIAVSGFGAGIEDLSIGTLQLTGQVYLGGLDDPANGLFFAGKLGGVMNGTKVKGLVALGLDGPRGICIEVDGGATGISIGYGFQINGFTGGVSFANNPGDPCDIQTYTASVIDENGDPLNNAVDPCQILAPASASPEGRLPAASITWAELAEFNRLFEQNPMDAYSFLNVRNPRAAKQMIGLMGVQGNESEEETGVRCPSGNCPPPSVNIFCQPHPDQDDPDLRDEVILKFSSLTPETLALVGVTPEYFASLGLTDAESLSFEIASLLFDGYLQEQFDALISSFDLSMEVPNNQGGSISLGEFVEQQMASIQMEVQMYFKRAICEALNSESSAAAQACFLGASNGGGVEANETVYQAVADAAYRGIPCFDATFKLQGVFSYVGVSAVLSVTGGVTLSTTGAAGIQGSLNLIGFPIGQLSAFLSGTDAQGLPNPSLCGKLEAGIGPLELGVLDIAFECKECVTGLLGAYPNLAVCLAGNAAAEVESALIAVAPGKDLLELSEEEILAFLTQLYSQPNSAAVGECFVGWIAESLDAFNPEILMCGEVIPKLFGVPLSPERYAVNGFASKEEMAFGFEAPVNYLFFGSYGSFLPPTGQAKFGFSMRLPDLDGLILAGLDGRLIDPQSAEQFARSNVQALLEDSTLTIEYNFSPFGLNAARAGARVIVPNLLEHPLVTDWVRPEDRLLNGNENDTAAPVPSRLEVMLAALNQGVLADSNWSGKEGQLPLLFPNDAGLASAVEDLSFSKDYFPHGGVVGAGTLNLPRILVNAPPPELRTLFDGEEEFLNRLAAAYALVTEHVLQTEEMGSMGFYFPAPNPPAILDENGDPLLPPPDLDLQAMIRSFDRFDPANMEAAGFYPFEEAFLQGYMNGRLLGVPIGEARVEAVPPQGGEEGYFVVASSVPSGSWLSEFVGAAEMTFEIRQTPPRPLEEEIAEVVGIVWGELFADTQIVNGRRDPGESFVDANANGVYDAGMDLRQPSVLNDVIELINERIVNRMPDVSLRLAVDELRIPESLRDIVQVDGQTSAEIAAFSPRNNPGLPGDDLFAEVERFGGIALRADMTLGGGFVIPGMQLLLTPGSDGAPPRIAGQFLADALTLAPGVVVEDLEIAIDSEPSPGQSVFSVAGNLSPIQFPPEVQPPWLTLTPIQEAGEFKTVEYDLDASGVSTLRVKPALLASPFFGGQTELRVYGPHEDGSFEFSTENEWGPAIAVADGPVVLTDADGAPILQFGSANDTHRFSIQGIGTQSASLTLEFDQGLSVTAFPGHPQLEREIGLRSSPSRTLKLIVDSAGYFELEGELSGDVSLASFGLPIDQFNFGAAVRVSDQGLFIDGQVSGGGLNALALPSVRGTFALFSDGGTQFEIDASIPPESLPIRFGVFAIDGVGNEGLLVMADGDEFQLNGAVLSIAGLNQEALTLTEFRMTGDGFFSAEAANGELNFADHFRVSSGSLRVERDATGAHVYFLAPQVVLFPGTAQQRNFSLIESAEFDQTGRFYLDTGERTIDLPGLFQANGRIELGYEPNGHAPAPSLSAGLLQFGEVSVGAHAVQTTTLSNLGGAPLIGSAIIASGETAYQVTPSSFFLEPGQSVELEVLFLPDKGGQVNGVLSLPNTSGEALTVNLGGQGKLEPIFHASLSDVIDFGRQAVGGGATRQLLISNVGTAPLELTGETLAAPFSVAPDRLTLAPKESRRVLIFFRPEGIGPAQERLRWFANDETGTHDFDLIGAGTEKRWYQQRSGSQIIRDLHMLNDRLTGWAAGEEGLLLKTTTGGRGWTEIQSPTTRTLNAVAFSEDGRLGWIAANAGEVFYTVDGGESWTAVTDNDVAAPSRDWNDIALYQAGSTARAVLVGRDNSNGNACSVYQTSAAAYRNVEVNAGPSLNGVAINNTWAAAVGDNGMVLISADNAQTWKPVPVTDLVVGARLHGVAVNSEGAAAAVGEFGVVYRTDSLNEDWRRVTDVGTEQFLYDVKWDGKNFWASGENGVMIRSEDLGNSWTTESVETGASLFATAAALNVVWASGRRGEIHQRPADPPSHPLLTLSTEVVDFGLRNAGALSAHELTLHNAGSVPLKFQEIQSDLDEGLALQGTPPALLEPGASARLRVVFDPRMEGAVSGSIDIVVPDDPMWSFQIEVKGKTAGMAFAALTSPSTDHFLDIQFIDESDGYALTEEEIYKTLDGGLTWTALNANPPGPLGRMHFITEDAGYAVGGHGGSSPFGKTDPAMSTVIRTLDGGKTWDNLTTGLRNRVSNVHVAIPGLHHFVYLILESYTSGGGNVPGEILYSPTSGRTWETLDRPSPFFGGGEALFAAQDLAQVYVGDGVVLYYTGTRGNDWTQVIQFAGNQRINDIQFTDQNHGWLVGGAGLFRRTTTRGIAADDWQAVAGFSTEDLRRVHFLDANSGWIVGDSAHRTLDGGITWENAASGANLLTIHAPSASTAYAGGLNGKLLKYAPAEAPQFGYLIASGSENFGTVERGEFVNRTLQWTNIGQLPVALENVYVESDSEAGEFIVLGELPSNVKPNETFQLTVRFTAEAVGNSSARLVVLSDGLYPAASTELIAEVPARDEVLVFDTEPSGLPLTINGVTETAPRVFTISADPSVENVLRPGESVSVEALEIVSDDAVSYHFSGWEPYRERTFKLETTLQSKTFIARYTPTIQSRSTVKVASDPRALFAAGFVGLTPIEGLFQTDIQPPAGPWIRLSGVSAGEAAALSSPVLGSFEVGVQAYLSSAAFELALEPSPFAFPEGSSIDNAWMHVDPGSLWVDYQRGRGLEVKVNSGVLHVLGKNAGVSPVIDFAFDEGGDFNASASFLNDAVVLPGLFEIGEGSLFAISTSPNPNVQFDGPVRVLRKPDESWMIDGNRAFTLSANGVEIPIDQSIGAALWNEGFVKLEPSSSDASIILTNENGVYAASLRDVRVDLFGNEITFDEAAANSQGAFEFAFGSIDLDFNSLVELQLDSGSKLSWNARQGGFTMNFAGGDIQLNDVDGWPTGGIPVDGFSVSSRNFTRSLPLPSFSFDGISIDSGSEEDAEDGKQYVRLKRTGNTRTFSVKADQDFFLSVMKMNLTATDSAFSGTLDGSFSVDDFPVYGDLEFGHSSLSYDSSRTDYPFQGTVATKPPFFAEGIQFDAKFGSSGAALCAGSLCLP